MNCLLLAMTLPAHLVNPSTKSVLGMDPPSVLLPARKSICLGFPECFSCQKNVELRWEDLSEENKVKVQAAKEKYIRAWLGHITVKRVTQGTLSTRS